MNNKIRGGLNEMMGTLAVLSLAALLPSSPRLEGRALSLPAVRRASGCRAAAMPDERPPLDVEWPIEDMFEGDRMKYPLFRKRLLSLLANPLTLIPQGIFLWCWLPSLSDYTRIFGIQRELDTFGSLEDLVVASLSITLGILVGTIVSVLRDRQQELKTELLSEMSVVESCAQQHVKLFRRDKPRLLRSMKLLSSYLAELKGFLDLNRNVDLRFASYEKDLWVQYYERQQRRSLAMLDILGEVGDAMLTGPRSARPGAVVSGVTVDVRR